MPKRTSKEIEEAIVRDYNNNMQIQDIVKKYNVSVATIHKVKKRYNVSNKRIGAPICNYDNNTINDIINDYKNGLNVISACAKYNMSEYTLYKILKDNNIALDRFVKTTKEQEQTIIKMYTDGYPLQDIMDTFNISRPVVRRILDINNIPKRNNTAIKYKITDKKIINSIINDYSNTDLLMNEICEKYKISGNTLRSILRRNNVPTRKSTKQKKYTDADIINDYNNTTVQNICNKYKISSNTVYAILKRNNVKTKKTKDKLIHRWE